MNVKKIFVIIFPTSYQEKKDIKSFLLLNIKEDNAKFHFYNSVQSMSDIFSIKDSLDSSGLIDIQFITSRYNSIYNKLKEGGILYRSIQVIFSKIKKINFRKKQSSIISQKLSKKKTIVVIGEGNFLENQSNFAYQTGQTGKEFSFVFIPVLGGQYCKTLTQLNSLILSSTIVSIYIFYDFDTSNYFIKKIKRNLSRCKSRLRVTLDNKKIKTFIVNLKKGTTEDLLKRDIKDNQILIKRQVSA
jgi:hypothetical protein